MSWPFVFICFFTAHHGYRKGGQMLLVKRSTDVEGVHGAINVFDQVIITLPQISQTYESTTSPRTFSTK
ncbi:hypothetical protein THAOC_16819 [Thalassiosira oceanica]|uniref:Uncharacterized protein n=1 Tax=Thalassiosira oceanica TaxID=159749 RepID=K0S8S7_THAOC|nr:hypothetical protein THAOC_16819 [Thalassiosira oceanica]|eukprot:EJK62563.1 hypothetical protein THAOC_16819 [Thalassiosira oceanica]